MSSPVFLFLGYLGGTVHPYPSEFDVCIALYQNAIYLFDYF